MKIEFECLNFNENEVFKRYLSIRINNFYKQRMPYITEVNIKGYIIRAYFLTSNLETSAYIKYISDANKIQYSFSNMVEVPVGGSL